MSTARIVTGAVMVVLGLAIMSIPFFAGVGGFISWIYGLPIFVIGIVILLNDKEDVIEQRKDKKEKNGKNK